MYNSLYQQPKPAYGDDIRVVNGKDSAKQYPMLPNSRVILLDGNDDKFYLKTTDASGIATVREFTFKEVEPEPTPQYLTMEQLKEVLDEYYPKQQQPVAEQSTSAVTEPTPLF